MSSSFVLRDHERGHDLIRSDGTRASYIAGHPDGFVTRASSFNFHDYQSGRPGFGPVRVFGDEVFHGAGCGYNMHPHHNFVICAFVLQGELTHVNTAGNGTVDQLRQGDYYVFSAGTGGKHSELSISPEDMNAIYLWLMPNQLFLPPTYQRAHFDQRTRRDRIEQLVGDGDGALSAPQDIRVSRLVTDSGKTFTYKPRSPSHGLYVFVLEGEASLDGMSLGRRDSLGIWDAERVELKVTADATDVLLVETLMIDDDKIRTWEAEHGHH
jgi:redox-sensitive bicupin YhaK (pirin superfamily)